MQTVIFLYYFLQEIGTQNPILYTGLNAEYKSPSWKTRSGIRTAAAYARLRCKIKFNTI